MTSTPTIGRLRPRPTTRAPVPTAMTAAARPPLARLSKPPAKDVFRLCGRRERAGSAMRRPAARPAKASSPTRRRRRRRPRRRSARRRLASAHQPRGRMLGTVGRKINDSAREAANAAKEAGKGSSTSSASPRRPAEQAQRIHDRAVGAVKNSAGAAADAAAGRGTRTEAEAPRELPAPGRSPSQLL